LKFDKHAHLPCIRKLPEAKMKKYKLGLWIFTSDQCPYTEKAVREITETAKEVYKIKTKAVELKTHNEAQECPSTFGTFCMVYNGQVIANHPISNTRFKNIMNGKR